MCVTKIQHVVILHMLKIYMSKSQGIFAPDMAGNPEV